MTIHICFEIDENYKRHTYNNILEDILFMVFYEKLTDVK